MENYKPYIKVGRLNYTVAKEAHLKCADIYVSENYLRHIQLQHGGELAALDIEPFDFVKLICDKFCEIRQGTGDSVLLLMYNDNLTYVASIALNYSLKDDFWEIKTAEPRRLRTIKNKALIWSAAKHSDNGNGNRPN